MELRSDLNIPDNLTTLGADRNRTEEMTRMAIEDPSVGGNPVPMNYDNTLELYERCFDWSS